MKISAKEAQKTIQTIINSRKRSKDESPVYSSSDDSDVEIMEPHAEPKQVDTIGVVPPQSDNLRWMERVATRAPFEPFAQNRYGMPFHDERSTNLYDWVDLRDKMPVYRLYRLINDEAIIEIGEKVFQSLSTTVTKRNICYLMLLAYNLRDASGKYIFAQYEKKMVESEEEFCNIEDVELSDDIPLSKWGYRINAKPRAKATSFSYIACSFLRLYTKSAENYKNVPAHITDKFTNFYDFGIAVLDFAPEETVVLAIKNQMNINDLLRNTFYLMLYAGESTPVGKNLKDFLYGIHNSYTGLHSYTLFLRCMTSLDVSNIQLANVIDYPIFRRPLKALVQVFRNLTGCRFNEDKRRQMWRYARIFEPRFLYDLQTKNCVTFAYALAYLYKKSSVITGNQDPLNIVQFKGISEYQRNTGALGAVRALAGLGIDLFPGNMKIVHKLLMGEVKKKKRRQI